MRLGSAKGQLQQRVNFGEYLDGLYGCAMVLSRNGVEAEDLVQETVRVRYAILVDCDPPTAQRGGSLPSYVIFGSINYGIGALDRKWSNSMRMEVSLTNLMIQHKTHIPIRSARLSEIR